MHCAGCNVPPKCFVWTTKSTEMSQYKMHFNLLSSCWVILLSNLLKYNSHQTIIMHMSPFESSSLWQVRTQYIFKHAGGRQQGAGWIGIE